MIPDYFCCTQSPIPWGPWNEYRLSTNHENSISFVDCGTTLISSINEMESLGGDELQCLVLASDVTSIQIIWSRKTWE